MSMIYAATGDREKTSAIVEKLGLCSDQELRVQFMMADKNINSIRSTSAGRLFDAVSAALGIRRVSTFEGEASTTLQFTAEKWSEDPGTVRYGDASTDKDLMPEPFACMAEDGALIQNTDAMFMWLVAQRLNGRPQEELAWMFHQSLADGIVEMCCRIREKTGERIAALSGGVFQNRLLLRMCEAGLEKEGFEVLIHSMVPPNDGGICLGQAAVAARTLYKSKKSDPSGKGAEDVQRTVEQIDELHM